MFESCATVVTPFPPIPVSPSHDDALLLQVGAKFIETWRLQRKLAAELERHEDSKIEQEFEKACDIGATLATRIRDIPALTIEGLRVKAQVVLWCCNGDMDDLFDASSTDLQLARSIVRDLLVVNPFATVTSGSGT